MYYKLEFLKRSVFLFFLKPIPCCWFIYNCKVSEITTHVGVNLLLYSEFRKGKFSCWCINNCDVSDMNFSQELEELSKFQC